MIDQLLIHPNPEFDENPLPHHGYMRSGFCYRNLKELFSSCDGYMESYSYGAQSLYLYIGVMI